MLSVQAMDYIAVHVISSVLASGITRLVPIEFHWKESKNIHPLGRIFRKNQPGG